MVVRDINHRFGGRSFQDLKDQDLTDQDLQTLRVLDTVPQYPVSLRLSEVRIQNPELTIVQKMN